MVVLAALLVAALLGLGALWRSNETAAHGIPAAELRALPPIVLSWQEQRPGPDDAGGVYTIRADGSRLRRVYGWNSGAGLKDGEVYGAEGVAWSPDRREVAIETWLWFGDPFTQVAIVSADGKIVKALEGLDCCGRSLAWSPAGAGLLFSRYDELHLYRTGTGRTARIWRSPNRGDRFEGVDWSPDGRELVAAAANRGLLRMTPAGDAIQWLTKAPPRTIDWSPQWSPSGRKMVFTRGVSVHTVGRDGQGLRSLNENARGGRPLWSPDGRSIVFTRWSRDGDPRDIVVMPEAGRPLRRLPVDAAAEAVDWSPDGTKILFLREARDPEKPSRTWWELWIMDSNGGRQTRLPFNRPGWSVLAADWRS